MNMGNSFIECKLREANWEIGKEYFTFEDGPFKGIKFYQTITVPEDVVFIHPFVVNEMLKNAAQVNQMVDIIIKKG